MSEGVVFRTVTFGGFHREDVMNYIAETSKRYQDEIRQLKEALAEAQAQAYQAAQESQRLRQEEQRLREETDQRNAEAERLGKELKAARASREMLNTMEAVKKDYEGQIARLKAQHVKESAKLQEWARRYEVTQEHVGQIEMEARVHALEVTREAEAQAAETVRSAREEASQMVKSAQEEAAETVRGAQEEAAETVQNAQEEAARLVRTAQEQHDSVMESIQTEADSLRGRIDHLLGDVTQNYTEVHSGVNNSISRALSEVDHIHDLLLNLNVCMEENAAAIHGMTTPELSDAPGPEEQEDGEEREDDWDD